MNYFNKTTINLNHAADYCNQTEERMTNQEKLSLLNELFSEEGRIMYANYGYDVSDILHPEVYEQLQKEKDRLSRMIQYQLTTGSKEKNPMAYVERKIPAEMKEVLLQVFNDEAVAIDDRISLLIGRRKQLLDSFLADYQKIERELLALTNESNSIYNRMSAYMSAEDQLQRSYTQPKKYQALDQVLADHFMSEDN